MATKTQLDPEDRRYAIDAMPEWVRLTAAYWTFPISRNRAELDLIMRELETFFDRHAPGEDELCRAVRWMAGPEGKQEKCPTLREVIRAVCIQRKAARQDRDGYATGENITADCKAAMIRSRSWRERWNILCQPVLYASACRDMDQDETIAVDAWALDRWGETWTMETRRIKAGFAESIRAARLAMQGAVVRMGAGSYENEERAAIAAG